MLLERQSPLRLAALTAALLDCRSDRHCAKTIVFKHDLTLIEHEAREAGYMASGMSYEEAHIKTCMDGYNYMKDLEEWKAAGNGDMV